MEIQVEDLTVRRIQPLERAARPPAEAQGDFYAFDALTPAELIRLRAQARAFAEILGVTVPALAAGVGDRWVFSDPASDRFGKEVETTTVTDEPRFVRGGPVGVAETTGAEAATDHEWESVENVESRDQESWVQE